MNRLLIALVLIGFFALEVVFPIPRAADVEGPVGEAVAAMPKAASGNAPRHGGQQSGLVERAVQFAQKLL